MLILSDNLRVALKLAIEARTEQEQSFGYTSDSALLAGWKVLDKKLQDKPQVILIVDEFTGKG